MDKVGRDELLVGVAEDALHVAARSGLEELVNLLDRGVAFRAEGEVNHRDVGGGHTEGHAGELALGDGEHLADGLGGAGGRGDDVDGRGTATAPVLLGGAVDGFLGGGVRVDRGHEAGFDTEALLEEDVDEGSKAVGRARGVRDLKKSTAAELKELKGSRMRVVRRQ